MPSFPRKAWLSKVREIPKELCPKNEELLTLWAPHIAIFVLPLRHAVKLYSSTLKLVT